MFKQSLGGNVSISPRRGPISPAGSVFSSPEFMMMATVMRASVLLACLCLSACMPNAPKPDPAQLEAAAVQTRRAQGEAAIREKRAERQNSRAARQEQQKLRDAMTRPGEEALRQSQGHREACLKARRTDPSIRCSQLGRVPTARSKQLEGHNFEQIP
jgi:hypothetical protein